MRAEMAGRLGLVGSALLVCAALAGCGSARFGGSGPTTVASARPVTVAPEPPPVAAAPSGSVTAEPLPPPPGSTPLSAGPVVADVPTMPTVPRPIEPLIPTPAAPVASLGSSRSSTVGSYTAQDAAGGSCRVSLTSSPALDLYKASASGCPNKDLARVTSWDFKDGEVYLYQPGGSVAARLRGSGGTLSGVLSKSGAPLTLTR